MIDMISQEFPLAEIVEHWGNSWKLKIPRDLEKSIGYLFGLVENLKNQAEVKEYSVSQTSLEQIFNNFAQSAELKE